MNLLDYLTPLDNKIMENYINLYGVAKENYIGNEEYLKYWAKCKPHLFHLLGGKLIYKFPIEVKKPEAALKAEITQLLEEKCDDFLDELNDRILHVEWEKTDETKASPSLYYAFCVNTFVNDAYPCFFRATAEGHSKPLQIPVGMKPIKVLRKIIDYFGWEDLLSDFENLRIAHSMVFNDKILKGNMCLSIHPVDFMTMSDNNSNWSSCMSWVGNGCYHSGTVEMMNSNNVLCCYLESKDNWYFDYDTCNNPDESYIWNNKKWRQLFYVTDEIAVCGKAYPYQSEDFSLIILNKIKELSELNLHKTYEFGPELYKDMVHIGSKYRMDKNRDWIYYGKTAKHNILFDTKGMYNDMFNDHRNLYWCYRNKVKKNTIISISGKAPCLCCGREIIKEDLTVVDSNYEGAYNDRYLHAGSVVCEECEDKRTCDCCHTICLTEKLYSINEGHYCEDCYQRFLRKCPECGNSFITRIRDNQLYIKKVDKLCQQDFYTFSDFCWVDTENVSAVFMCEDCRNKVRDKFIKITPQVDHSKNYYEWKRIKTYYISKETTPKIDESIWSKFLYKNLEKIDLANCE